MATPADQRLLELLDLWLRSLELHLQYVSLDDASYGQIQAWPPHQRPTRWILDLAQKKTLAVRAQVEERIEKGDTNFAESLETMVFLANLVGLQHIERFIPLAQSGREVVLEPTLKTETALSPSNATATREMPKFIAERPKAARTTPRAAKPPAKPPKPAAAPSAAPPAATPTLTSSGAPASAAPDRAAAPTEPPRSRAPTPAPAPTPAVSPRQQVIADADRLLQWGRKWYELAELIARMADRPPLPEVRRILKEHKAALDKGDSSA
jgi:hypothetical protein